MNTGPIHVEGAQPGDLLKVTIDKLQRRVPYWIISNRHGKGALNGEYPRGEANVSIFAAVAQGSDGTARGWMAPKAGAPRELSFDLAPFFETIGVAVAGEVRPHSVPPGAHGGMGQASIGLGTDTGGSIRVPASYQGLWGIRSTHGAISRRGLLPLAQSFDAVGWMTRDADTLGAVAQVLLAPTEAQAKAQTEHPTLAPGTPLKIIPRLFEQVEPEVAEAVRAAVAAQTSSTAESPAKQIEELEGVSAEMHAAWFEAFRIIQFREAWANHGAWIDDRWEAMASDVGTRFRMAGELTEIAAEIAQDWTDLEVDAALAQHPRIGEKVQGSSREAQASRREQGGLTQDEVAQQEWISANQPYEDRFDRIFLIRAADLTPAEMMTQLRLRLQNSPEEEAGIRREQLAQIAVKRLEHSVA